MSGLLPLFPLSLVLLPTAPLPLHIFEERYKELMADVIPRKAEFGVVLAKEGGIVNIGCTATVEQVVRRFPDGRLDLIAVGRRRFQIQSLDEEKSYLQAEVEYFGDDDTEAAAIVLQQQAILACQKLQQEAPELAPAEFRVGEPQLSFRLAQLIEDVDYRQTILAIKSETARLAYLLQNLPKYLSARDQIALAKRVAPTNGHAKHFKES
jgi:Lon protease-like protein